MVVRPKEKPGGPFLDFLQGEGLRENHTLSPPALHLSQHQGLYVVMWLLI